MPAKFNMRPDKNKMPSQDPKQRAKNFKEVTFQTLLQKLKKKITKVLIK